MGSLNFLLGVHECCCGISNLIFLRFGLGDVVRDRWVDGVLFSIFASCSLLYAYYMFVLDEVGRKWARKIPNKYHRVWIPLLLFSLCEI